MKMQSLLTIMLATVLFSSSSNGQTETDVHTPAVTYCTDNQTEDQCKRMMRYDRRDKIESRFKRTSYYYCDDEVLPQASCRSNMKELLENGCVSIPYVRDLLFLGTAVEYDTTPEGQRNYTFLPICSGHRLITFCECGGN